MENFNEFLVESPKAVVLTIHGLGEHIGRYNHVGKWLNENQIVMVGGDLPGFGKSTKMKGHLENFNEYLLKVDEWIQYIDKKWPKVPIFLFGHSLGGLIVLRYIEEIDNNLLKGIILTSPSISIKLKVPKWQILLAKSLRKIYPTLRLKSGIKSYQVSRSKEVVEKYGSDPLNYGKVSVGLFCEFQDAIEMVWKKLGRVNDIGIPLLFLQAGDDQLTDPNRADEFVKEIKQELITYINIPELYHEVFNEPENEIYLKIFSDWISEKSIT
ncbi:MAG: lysophospholipase [Vulcanibacillus sp.]